MSAENFPKAFHLIELLKTVSLHYLGTCMRSVCELCDYQQCWIYDSCLSIFDDSKWMLLSAFNSRAPTNLSNRFNIDLERYKIAFGKSKNCLIFPSLVATGSSQELSPNSCSFRQVGKRWHAGNSTYARKLKMSASAIKSPPYHVNKIYSTLLYS